MNRISLYIFRHLAVATLIATTVLTFAIWLTQSLRLIEVIVDGSAPFGIFLQMVVLSLPKFLTVVIPVAMVGAVLFTYNRLLQDSELVVMRAAGMGPARLAGPAAAMAVVVALVVMALNLYFVPVSNQTFRDIRTVVSADYSALFLREGQFNALSDGLTVYVRERERNGELLGILIHDNRDPAEPVTMVAERGALVNADSGPQVVLFDGNRQEAVRATNQVNVLYFDQYAVDLETLEPQVANAVRNRDADERFIGELLNPNMEDNWEAAQAIELRSEGHQRLSSSLMAFGFVAIAMGALLSGEFSRRGQNGRLLGAIAAVVVLQACYMGLSSASQENAALFPALYALPLAAMAGGILLMHRRPGAWRRRILQATA